MHSLTNPDSASIQRMFDRLAGRYDLFNRLTSLGMDALWRRKAIGPVRPGMRVLDLGCGTGDLSILAARRVGASGKVVGLDFSGPMLEIARERARKLGPEFAACVDFVQKKAEDLPMGPEPFDAVVSGFVLRNLYENIDRVLDGVYRSLVPGGVVSFVDITEPADGWRRAAWRSYMGTAAALYGRALFGRDYPKSYLTESAERFLKAPEFIGALRQAGFHGARATDLWMGTIVWYEARKPGRERTD